jgi:nicotinamidase-related amidase
MNAPRSTFVPMGTRAGSQWLVNKTSVDMTRAPQPVRPVELDAIPQRITIDANKSAMIVIDMQNDFCTEGGWLDHIGVDFSNARRPIEPLRVLLPVLRAARMPVVWVNWGNRPDKLNISPALLHVYNGDGARVGLGDPLPTSPKPGARVLERDSWAAAVVDELVIEGGDIRVHKYRMSGFWDTELDSILRNLGVTTVLFGGVNADQCVLATLMDANFLGYDTILVEDCTATTSPEFCWQATLYNVRQCFGFTTRCAALLQGLQS